MGVKRQGEGGRECGARYIEIWMGLEQSDRWIKGFLFDDAVARNDGWLTKVFYQVGPQQREGSNEKTRGRVTCVRVNNVFF